MTRRATTPTPIPATTETGTGLILPIAKALNHIMSVYTAVTREWPMTTSEAIAEIDDAARHLQNLTIPRELMTEGSVEQIGDWLLLLNNSLTEIRLSIPPDENIATSVNTAVIRLLASQTWSLITILDRELTGLEVNNTDPGRLP